MAISSLDCKVQEPSAGWTNFHVDRIDARPGRASSDGALEANQRFAIPFGCDGHTPVRLVADHARQALASSGLIREPAEPDTLDAANHLVRA